MYFQRTPNIIKRLYPSIIWDLPNDENKIYLTFDDGPHPEITPWILAKLKQYNAKATFFCLGINVEKYPEIVTQILNDGHRIGNHGYAHLNGWKTKDVEYFEDVEKCYKLLVKKTNNGLYRPAYGKIKMSQLSSLKSQYKIVNWTLMPGDFDQNISSEKCYENLCTAKVGDIVVLHDNDKSRKHLEYCLPKFLDFIYNKGLKSDCITL